MGKFYIMEADSPFGNYPELNADSIDAAFRIACFNSSFQHIYPKIPQTIYVSEDSEDIYTDFMYDYGNCIPLISDRFRNFLDDFGTDNVLYKKIILKNPFTRSEYECWLALPSRIDCLDFEKSKFSRASNAVISIAVSEFKVGRYDIFKMSRKDDLGAAGAEIIITEKLKNYLSQKNLEGVYFHEL